MPHNLIPALRAVMGDWVYFVATMSLKEVAQRVHFASEIHSSRSLNELIQRRLNDKRAESIADYLIREEQRFFNALVVGVYGGEPDWYDFDEISPVQPSDDVEIPPNAMDTFGFLSFAGPERLFALDGQHRLAGIRQALSRHDEIGSDRVAVIFVAHHSGEQGLQRTRRLFTVLNKTAKPVLKGDIIALDEDDLMAICTRRLVEQCRYFNRGQVAMRLLNSLTPKDRSSWTTITMVYDMLGMIFLDAYPKCGGVTPVAPKNIKTRRASEALLDEYYQFAVRYFELLGDQFTEVGEALAGSSPSAAVQDHRNPEGGHVLFRPLGQKIFTQIVATLCREHSLEYSVQRLGELPTSLSEPPYSYVIWNPDKRTMENRVASANLARDLLLSMLGERTRWKPETLRRRYALSLGRNEQEVELPELVRRTD